MLPTMDIFVATALLFVLQVVMCESTVSLTTTNKPIRSRPPGGIRPNKGGGWRPRRPPTTTDAIQIGHTGEGNVTFAERISTIDPTSGKAPTKQPHTELVNFTKPFTKVPNINKTAVLPDANTTKKHGAPIPISLIPGGHPTALPDVMPPINGNTSRGKAPTKQPHTELVNFTDVLPPINGKTWRPDKYRSTMSPLFLSPGKNMTRGPTSHSPLSSTSWITGKESDWDGNTLPFDLQPSARGKQPGANSGTVIKMLFRAAEDTIGKASKFMSEAISTVMPAFHTYFTEKSHKKIARILSSKARSYLRYMIDRQGGVADADAFNLTSLSENDVKRLSEKLTMTPDGILTQIVNNISDLTTQQISIIPVNVISALSRRKIAELGKLPQDKKLGICSKLLSPSSSYVHLMHGLMSSLQCETVIEDIHPESIGESNAKVFLEYLRALKGTRDWTDDEATVIMSRLAPAFSDEDIRNCSRKLAKHRLPKLLRMRVPKRYHRRAILASVVDNNNLSLGLLKQLGDYWNDIPINVIRSIKPEEIEEAIQGVDKSKIKSNSHRVFIQDALKIAMPVTMSSDQIKTYFPWLMSRRSFLEVPSLTTMMEAIRHLNITSDNLDKLAVNVLARRLEEADFRLDYVNETTNSLTFIGNVLEGFTDEYLHTLNDTTISDLVTRRKRLLPLYVARQLLKENTVRKMLAKNELDDSVTMLFNALQPHEVSNISEHLLLSMFPRMSRLELPAVLAKQVARRLGRRVIEKGRSLCNDGLQKLGNLAKYISRDLLRELKIIPIGIVENCDNTFNELNLHKAQAYVIVDNVKEWLVNMTGDEAVPLPAEAVRQLGKLVIGLSEDDIERLPIDSETLTTIGLLSKHEDVLDSAQISAIVRKIRAYFDMDTRQNIEASDINMMQIGRFLPYMNVPRDLLMFPKRLRATMIREMGKTSMTKLPRAKRRLISLFAHGFMSTDGKEMALSEMGNLVCSLPPETLELLLQETEEFSELVSHCPFTAAEGTAVTENVARSLSDSPGNQTVTSLLVSLGSNLRYLGRQHLINRRADVRRVSEILVKEIYKKDRLLEAIRSNGLMRDYSAEELEDDKGRRATLMQDLYGILNDTYGHERCFVIHKLGNNLRDIPDFSETDIINCLHEIGEELIVNKKQAKGVLDKLAKEGSGQIWTAISKAPTLVQGLTKSIFNATNVDHISSSILGDVKDLSAEQMAMGFTGWTNTNKNLFKIGLGNIHNLVCGAPLDVLRDTEPGEIRDNLGDLGTVDQCDKDHLKTIAGLLPLALEREPRDFRLDDIVEIGHLIGGLEGSQLRQLTRTQLRTIETNVVSKIPEDTVKEFTASQLEQLTDLQKEAITDEQRSYFSPQQMEAILPEVFSKDDGTHVLSNTSTIILLLAFARQCVMFCAFK